MKNVIVVLLAISILTACNKNPAKTQSRAQIKGEIEKILQLQEGAYQENTVEAKKRTGETCEDSLIYIGGDSGGLSTHVDGYIYDLADGYTIKPHDRVFQIYDNTVIVTSLHQSYKLLAGDTLYLNARSTKIFVRHGAEWKMAYITNAPVPVIYSETYKGSTAKFSDYAGAYQVDVKTYDTISVRNGELYSSLSGSDVPALKPINDSTFIGQGYFGKTIFSRNSKGKVTHYYFEWTDGQRINFPKIN